MGDPIQELKDRAASRKRNGADQSYPQHAGKAVATPTTTTRLSLPTLPCAYVGPDSGAKGWHYCEHPDTPLGDVVCSCKGCGVRCPGYATELPAPVVSTTLIDSTRLAPARDGRHFNCSIFDWQGKRLLAYRVGWSQSEIHVAELGDDLQPVTTTPLLLKHPKCAMGREDPRLFAFGGRLHLIFAGLEWRGGRLIVSQMIAELGDDLQVTRVWEPRYASRTLPYEKNWMPFESGGQLYCVYSTRPHQILHIDTQKGIATLAHESSGPPDTFWSGWKLRGGAPPLRVGNQFVSFFHGWRRSEKSGREWFDYATGVYAFNATAPFQVTRICRQPIWKPDPHKRHLNVTADKDVIFPSGAVLVGDEWLVSAGHQDSECLVAKFPKSQIESVLEYV